MEWIQTHIVGILAVIGAADGLFYAITKLTKSDKDDNLYTIVHNFIFKFLPKGDGK